MFRSKASTYAILAVIEIARRQQRGQGGVQAREIAECLQIPAAYGAKVMTQLARANILRSDRGPRGGFRLARSPDEIDMLEIVEAVDGLIGADAGIDPQSPETGGVMPGIDAVFAGVAEQARERLRQHTIARFVTSERPVTEPIPQR